jgi:hypothetical protein
MRTEASPLAAHWAGCFVTGLSQGPRHFDLGQLVEALVFLDRAVVKLDERFRLAGLGGVGTISSLKGRLLGLTACTSWYKTVVQTLVNDQQNGAAKLLILNS